MILYRTVARGSALYHQGVLIDVDQLGSWLRQRSIGRLQLASVDFATEGQTDTRPDDPDSPLYRHRFAPPFAALSARLRLKPLAFDDSRNYLEVLSAALVAATLIGLILFYRMVSVTLRFAERRGNFVAAVTHELRTPLTAIRMYGEMLRDGVVPSEAKRAEYYRHITNESERLSRLINNVLEYSRLEKGNRQVRSVSGSIVPVLRQVAEMMSPHAAERGYELVLDIEPDLPAAQFEADALAQVLWNLVDNAIKYAGGASDRRIVLGARRDGDRILLSVRDYGAGVERRHLAEIFEPFYRGENELTRTAKGTGLGLALVRGLLERMGATVRARNAEDAGFVVEIRLQMPDGAG
jgi:signal transduction histidine kinase